MNRQYKALTPEELYAFEQLARRERSQVLAELLKAAGRSIAHGFATLVARPQGGAGKVVRHA